MYEHSESYKEEIYYREKAKSLQSEEKSLILKK